MTNVSLSGLSTSIKLSLLYQVFIYKIYILPQLCQLWANIQSELVNEGPYKVSINRMRLQLAELQESDNKAWKIGAKILKNGYEEVDEVLHYQKLPFSPEIIQTELIS